MDSWEELLSGLLGDPGKLDSLLSLASSFAGAPAEPPPPAAKPEPPGRVESFLAALRPFLQPARRTEMDRAIQAARLSRLAGRALRGPGPEGPEGGAGPV